MAVEDPDVLVLDFAADSADLVGLGAAGEELVVSFGDEVLGSVAELLVLDSGSNSDDKSFSSDRARSQIAAPTKMSTVTITAATSRGRLFRRLGFRDEGVSALTYGIARQRRVRSWLRVPTYQLRLLIFVIASNLIVSRMLPRAVFVGISGHLVENGGGQKPSPNFLQGPRS